MTEILCYKPRIFHLFVEPEWRQFVRLLDDPMICKHDTIFGQLRDLIITRYPSKELTDDEIDKHIREHLNGTPINKYGVMVYYPWDRSLVHLLGESEFVELRTNRNKYKISADEQDTLASKHVGIVGLSSGHAIALTIATERSCGELRIADFDSLDLSNLNRIRTGVDNLGVPKVCITAREIAKLDPFLNVTCFFEGVTVGNIESFFSTGGMLDCVIDVCDSLDIKVHLREFASTHGVPLVMATSDRGMFDIERFDTNPEYPFFHGLVGDMTPEELKRLKTSEEKVPVVLKILGADTMTARTSSSLVEIGESIKTWPQLGSHVELASAETADSVRRIMLGENILSGRYFVDFDELIPEQLDVAQNTTEQDSQSVTTDIMSAEMHQYISQICHSLQYKHFEHTVALEIDDIRTLVEHAIRAPSGGNMQPWSWYYKSPTLFLFLDCSRSESLLDFNSYGSFVALGAAAENLVLAAHSRVLEVSVNLFPDKQHNGIVVALSFFSKTSDTDETCQSHDFDHLYDLLEKRHTNRRLSTQTALSHETLHAIKEAACSISGAELNVLDDPNELDELGSVLGEGDRIRLLDQSLHNEMMSELKWTEEPEINDGIRISELELSAFDEAGLRVCRRWDAMKLLKICGGGKALEKPSQKALKAASAACVLTMPIMDPVDFFNGGRAMQRAWLTATLHNVAFQPMTALLYLFMRTDAGGRGLSLETVASLNALRPRYEALFNSQEINRERSDVLLFRLANVEESNHRSLRRSIDDVLFVDE